MTRRWLAVVCFAATPVMATPVVDVCFSPGGECEKRVVREIEAAKKMVLVQAHVFTSRPIADALVAARKRGVDVQVILDASNTKDRYSAMGVLKKGGVEVALDGKHPVANNKVVVIDGAVVLTGSMNFTKAADDSNAENLVVIRDAGIAGQFVENWKAHYEHRGQAKDGDTVAGAPKGSGKQPSAPAGDPKPASKDGMVVVTENGKRYHRPDCETVKGGGVEMTVDEAKKKGKTPCRRCKPDGG